jgi:peptide/nickel transport system ATP-binding protein
VALVGESGCGKSMTALSILRLVPRPGRIAAGRLLFQDRDILSMSYEERRQLRGGSISMIFQEPMTSLNPVLTVGTQVREAVLLHQKASSRASKEIALDMLQRVGIPDPYQRYSQYPHQLSGGMKQRVMIAMALVSRPSLLIADEPTTALDVTIQSQILALMKSLQEEIGMGLLLITHDLGVVCEMADRVIVMYAGRMMESGSVHQIFSSRAHPYTQGLFNSLPITGQKGKPLKEIPGRVPELWELPAGCPFYGRCPVSVGICESERPLEKEVAPGHIVWCHAHG